MSNNKQYDSVTYIAGRLKFTLRDADAMRSLELGAINDAKQGGISGEKVSFQIGSIENIVTFSRVGDKYHVKHEMIGIEGIKVRERGVRVKRSKTGRISDDYFTGFIGQFLIPNLREYSRSNRQ